MRCGWRYLQFAILFCGIIMLEGRGGVAATNFVCQSSRNMGSARAACLVSGMLSAWAILANAGKEIICELAEVAVTKRVAIYQS